MTKATSITFPAPQAARSLIRVGIVDDDKGTRQALAGFLQGDPEIDCIGTFGSAEEPLRDLPAKRPDTDLPQSPRPLAGPGGGEDLRAAAMRYSHTNRPGRRITVLRGRPPAHR